MAGGSTTLAPTAPAARSVRNPSRSTRGHQRSAGNMRPSQENLPNMRNCTMARMPKLAANLSLLFAETAFLDRFAAAARAGFRGVEYQFPYAFPARAVAERARAAGVEVVLHNIPAGDAARGDRGIACLPERASEVRDGVERAPEDAGAAGRPRLHSPPRR